MNPELENLKVNNNSKTTIQMPEASNQEDSISTAENIVLDVVAKNIYDSELEHAIHNEVVKHFDEVRQNPPYTRDKFAFVELNQKIWSVFRKYEEQIHEQRVENVNLNELARILSEVVTQEISKKLFDLTVSQSQ